MMRVVREMITPPAIVMIPEVVKKREVQMPA